MTDEWKRRYGIFIHTRALLSNNKSEMLICVTNWMELKGVMMTKVRGGGEKDQKNGDLSHIQNIKKPSKGKDKTTLRMKYPVDSSEGIGAPM